MLSLFCLLACPKAPPPAPPPEPTVRVVLGPWLDASALALRITGPSSVSRTAPAILLAAFVSEQTLWFTTSLNGGRGWRMPVGLAAGVSTGQQAQARPEILLSLGQTSVLTLVEGAPTLMRRQGEGWSRSVLEPEARSAAMDGMVWDSSTLVVWSDPQGPSLRLWWEGRVEVLAEGPQMNLCARPALGVVDGRPSVAWLQGGALHQLSLDEELQWRAAPERTVASLGCDGPVFVGEQLLVGDGGQLRLGQDALDLHLEGDWSASQGRGLGVWLEQDGRHERVFVDGVPLLTGPVGSMEIWEPVQVGPEIWVPFSKAGSLTLVAYQPDSGV